MHRLILLGVLLLTFAGPSRPAEAFTLTVEHQGSWSCCPLQQRSFGHFVGASSWIETRAYFTFDTTGLGGPLTAATLRLWNPLGSPGFGGFLSPDPTETLTLFDVGTTPPALRNGELGGFAAWVDLGTGTPYGSVTVSEADEGVWVEVALNAAGLAAFNERIGTGRPRVSIGAALTTLQGGFATEYIFSQAGERAQLVVTVPEPHAAGLLAASFAACAAARRRRL